MNKKSIIITIVIIVLTIGIITSNKNNVTYAIGDTLVSTVIAQSQGTTWSSGASGVYNTTYSNGGSDYRYIGVNINNYVKFNNDLYRIIGVFDENTHGIEEKYLVKLIRAKILVAFSWGIYNTSAASGVNSNYCNDWTGVQYKTPANANILLNEYFLNKTNTSDTYGECSDWTYIDNGNKYKTTDCSTILGYGIDENFRNYIETVTWHLNGYQYDDLTSKNFYLCERGMYTDCTSANSGAADTSTSAKIGLMYVSDYMYASGYKASNSGLTGSSNYNGNQNWLFNGPEWTITPKHNNAISVFYIYGDGHMNTAYSYTNYSIRPTFYLKEDVYVTGGNGSIDNPYTIACDTCG